MVRSQRMLVLQAALVFHPAASPAPTSLHPVKGELNPAFATGPFELPIAEISTYMAQPVTPRIVHVSSAGVTRPDRPGIDVEQEPPAVKLNAALGGLLTYKLAGEDAIRSSGVPSVVVRPTALTEEAGRMPIEIDQGDVIKV